MALEEVLSLDVAGALSEIDSLGSSLTQVAQQFKVDLSDAVTVLQGVQVEVDTSSVTSEIDAATEGTTVVVEVEADTTAVDAAIVEESTPEPITVPVEADTAAAQAELTDLTASASAASAGAGELGGSIDGAGAAADLAGGSIGGLTSSIGSLVPAAAAPIAAAVGVAAAIHGIFESAVEAEGQIQAFDAATGRFAADVRNVNVAGLNVQLEDLATTLGSDDEALLGATQKLFTLGEQSGATGEQAAEVTGKVAALAANAVALNPSLGDVAAVTEKLTKGLARGGRALTPFGISLSAAEVNARALKDTGKETAAELNQFDKTAAAASLALDKFGGSIATNIERGSKNSIITLARLREQVSDTIETVGQPLIAPMFEAIEEAQPFIIQMATLLANLGTAILPIGTAILKAFSPAVTAVVTGLSTVLKALEPVFEGLSSIIGALTPVITFLTIPVKLLGVVFTALKPVLEFIGEVLKLIAEGAEILLSPLSALNEAVDKEAAAADEMAAAMKTASGETIQMADAATSLKAIITGTTTDFAKFVTTSTGFAGAGVTDSLRKTGVSMQDLQGQLKEGDKGYKEFTARAIESGQAQLLNADGTKVSAKGLRDFNGSLSEAINTGRVQIAQGAPLLTSFQNLAGATQAESKALFDAQAAQLSLTDAQLAAITIQSTSTTGAVNYTTALQTMNAQVADGTLKQQGAAVSLQGNADAWIALTQQITSGQVTQENAALAMQNFGLDAEKSAAFLDATKVAVQQFVDTAVGGLPTAQGVFDSLKNATDPTAAFSLPQNLEKARKASADFANTINGLGSFPEVQKFLATAGPEAAAQFQTAYAAGGTRFAQETENQIKLLNIQNERSKEVLEKAGAENIAVATTVAQQTTKGYADGLDFTTATKDSVASASAALTASTAEATKVADASGKAVGAAYVDGEIQGMKDRQPALNQQAINSVNEANAAGSGPKGANTGSPSKLFAKLGEDMAAGIALGLDAGTSEVANASIALVNAAADVANVTPTGSGTVQAPADSGGITVGSITMELVFQGNPSESEARVAGQAAMSGAIAQLQRQVNVDSRTV